MQEYQIICRGVIFEITSRGDGDVLQNLSYYRVANNG